MSSTNFIDGQTVIYASWLNDVNNWTYNGVPQAQSITVPTAIFTGTSAVTLPAGTTAQRSGTPVAGMIRLNTDGAAFEGYNGTSWGGIGGGATGGGTDQIFVENGVTVTTDYTFPVGKNASSVGPITINSGITVTIPDGQRWVVL